MIDVSKKIPVDVPLAAAFEYYTDQDRLQEWIPGDGILEFTPLMPPPKRPGSRYRMAYRSFGVTFRLITELTKLDSNNLSEMQQVTGDYRSFQYDMKFNEAGTNSTYMTIRIRAALPWGILGRILEYLTRTQAQREVNNLMTRFKRGVELFWKGQKHTRAS
ncbi:MAG: hypothetical protein ACM3SP_15415 [Chloroflexota bacterium]